MKSFFLMLLIITTQVFSQVENVTVTHPVYDLLIRFENKGLLPHFSSSDFPLSRGNITDILIGVESNNHLLTGAERKSLDLYLKEFDESRIKNAVLVYSKSDNSQVFSDRLFSNDEKFIYKYSDEKHNLSIKPLANIDSYFESYEDDSEYFNVGNLGFRMYGTLDGMFGYNLQVTNGILFAGSRELAGKDAHYAKNFKLTELDSDIDFTESHLRFQYDWFYINIGRESRLMGAGINQNIFLNQNAIAFDAISMGADFKKFKYRFTHGSLIGISDSGYADWGQSGVIEPKYIALHKFSITPKWGEISFWESVVYSRPMDIAYLNPLSFFKSLEHALRDRDNVLMGLDLTIRPIKNLQIKSSFLLDDIIFGEIGNGFWGNKTASNYGIQYVFPFSIDAGFEYSRVEPFTYSHFNPKNSYTNDKRMLANSLLPNSDRFNFMVNWWWGGRYPLKLDISYTRHGENIYDEEGNLVRNVGSEPMLSITKETPEFVRHLDGNKVYIFDAGIDFGFEIFRGLNVRSKIGYRTINSAAESYFRIIIGIYEI